MIKFVLLIVGSLLSVVLNAQSAIVPQPVNVTYGSKYFDITASKIRTTTPENLSFEIDYLRTSLRQRAQQNTIEPFRSDSLSIPIVLQLFNPDTLLPEGWYSLKTSEKRSVHFCHIQNRDFLWHPILIAIERLAKQPAINDPGSGHQRRFSKVRLARDAPRCIATFLSS